MSRCTSESLIQAFMNAFLRQFEGWKKELANVLEPDTVATSILKHWNNFNNLLDFLDNTISANVKSQFNIRQQFTDAYCNEYLSEYLQFIFDHILQFEEKEIDVGTDMDVGLKRSFVQLVKLRFSPRPLSELCCEIITKRVSNVRGLSKNLPNNLISAVQNYKDLNFR
jgi:hypothetical protein